MIKETLTPDLSRTTFVELPKVEAPVGIALEFLEDARIVYAIIEREPREGDFVVALNRLSGRVEACKYTKELMGGTLRYVVYGVIASATIKLLRS